MSRVLTRPLASTYPRALRSCTSSKAQRALWTAATCSHPDLATSLSRCFPTSSTTTPPPSSEPPKNVTIVLASRSYPGSDLLNLPSAVPQHIRDSSTVLSVIVDRVPTRSGHGVSTLTLTPSATLLSCKPFHLSGAESRRKRLKEKSVGKWARAQDIEERSLDTADAWNAFKSISIGRNQVQVPEAALPSSSSDVSSNDGPNAATKQQQEVIVFSDLEVHQFLEALDTVYYRKTGDHVLERAVGSG
ncbi:hypothetical protein BGZ93_003677, partial [Podila epicladia]